MKPHTHSNIARHIVNSLVIAKLDRCSTFIGKMYEKHEVNLTTSIVDFKIEGPNSGVKSFYRDLRMVSKHFLIKSTTKKHLNRTYTICNSMRPEF